MEIYTSNLNHEKVIIAEQITRSVKKITEFYFKNSELKLVIEKEQILGRILKENHYYYDDKKIVKQIINQEYDTIVDTKQFETLDKTLSSKLRIYNAELGFALLKSKKVISFK